MALTLLHHEQLGAHVSEVALSVHVLQVDLEHVILCLKDRQDLQDKRVLVHVVVQTGELWTDACGARRVLDDVSVTALLEFDQLMLSCGRRALSRASKMCWSASHASLAVLTAVPEQRRTGSTEIWVVSRTNSLTMSQASDATLLLAPLPEAGRSVTTAAQNFSLINFALQYTAQIL